MNPNIDKFPMVNTGPTGANMQGSEIAASTQVVEQLPSREATSFAPAQPAVPPAPIIADSAQTPAASPTPATQTAAAVSIPHVTGDEEDLEKKWVAVAKTIVERTKGDPYLQSLQINKAGKEFRAQTGRGVNPDEE
jgi:hypothetical protein